jgi:hypothetical protein
MENSLSARAMFMSARDVSARNLVLKIADALIKRPALLNLAMLPARAFRALGLTFHRFLFKGNPALFNSTAEYARALTQRHRPTGPKVALLTGCLMEGCCAKLISQQSGF